MPELCEARDKKKLNIEVLWCYLSIKYFIILKFQLGFPLPYILLLFIHHFESDEFREICSSSTAAKLFSKAVYYSHNRTTDSACYVGFDTNCHYFMQNNFEAFLKYWYNAYVTSLFANYTVYFTLFVVMKAYIKHSIRAFISTF